MAKSRKDRDPEDEAIDELYVGDFEGFVARRNELAKRLRAGGDAEAAERVRALKKPSRAAWTINQVSAQEPQLRDELLAAGVALREAQEQLVAGKGQSAELRKASEKEHAAVSGTLDAARALSGDRLSPAALERARQTLHAVARDEGVRLDFQRRRLTTEHEASGLSGFSPGTAPARGGKAGNRTGAAKKDDRQKAKRRREQLSAEAEARKLGERERKAQRDVERARQDATQAQRDLERATKALDKVSSAAAAARERASELRERSG